MLPTRPALEPKPAVTGLLELFAARPLVALGEMHNLQEQADFITQPRRHSSFDTTANTYVQSGPFKDLDLLINTAWHPSIQPCVPRRRLWVKSARRPLNTEHCQSTYESLNFRKI